MFNMSMYYRCGESDWCFMLQNLEFKKFNCIYTFLWYRVPTMKKVSDKSFNLLEDNMNS